MQPFTRIIRVPSIALSLTLSVPCPALAVRPELVEGQRPSRATLRPQPDLAGLEEALRPDAEELEPDDAEPNGQEFLPLGNRKKKRAPVKRSRGTLDWSELLSAYRQGKLSVAPPKSLSKVNLPDGKQGRFLRVPEAGVFINWYDLLEDRAIGGFRLVTGTERRPSRFIRVFQPKFGEISQAVIALHRQEEPQWEKLGTLTRDHSRKPIEWEGLRIDVQADGAGVVIRPTGRDPVFITDSLKLKSAPAAGMEEAQSDWEPSRRLGVGREGTSGRGARDGAEFGADPRASQRKLSPRSPSSIRSPRGGSFQSPFGNIHTLHHDSTTSPNPAANLNSQGTGLMNSPDNKAAGNRSLNTSMAERAMNSRLLSEKKPGRMPSTIVQQISIINKNPAAGLEEAGSPQYLQLTWGPFAPEAMALVLANAGMIHAKKANVSRLEFHLEAPGQQGRVSYPLDHPAIDKRLLEAFAQLGVGSTPWGWLITLRVPIPGAGSPATGAELAVRARLEPFSPDELRQSMPLPDEGEPLIYYLPRLLHTALALLRWEADQGKEVYGLSFSVVGVGSETLLSSSRPDAVDPVQTRLIEQIAGKHGEPFLLAPALPRVAAVASMDPVHGWRRVVLHLNPSPATEPPAAGLEERTAAREQVRAMLQDLAGAGLTAQVVDGALAQEFPGLAVLAELHSAIRVDQSAGLEETSALVAELVSRDVRSASYYSRGPSDRALRFQAAAPIAGIEVATPPVEGLQALLRRILANLSGLEEADVTRRVDVEQLAVWLDRLA